MGDKKNIKKQAEEESSLLDISNEEKKNPWQILMFAIVLIVILYLFNVFFGPQNDNNLDTSLNQKVEKTLEKDAPTSNLKVIANKKEMATDYRSVISNIKGSFLKIEDKTSNTELAKFSYDSLDMMFKAVVPLINKPFHLKLTLSLNTINKLSILGEEENSDLIEEVDKLGSILEEWQ
jgi:hypothetical protein